jgi:hypothetical protein
MVIHTPAWGYFADTIRIESKFPSNCEGKTRTLGALARLIDRRKQKTSAIFVSKTIQPPSAPRRVAKCHRWKGGRDGIPLSRELM